MAAPPVRAAAAGLGVVIVRVQPLFEAIWWAGIAYLLFLGAQAFRSAIRGRYEDTGPGPARDGRRPRMGWRQGLLANITNPKALGFYLAVLPQFLGPHASVVTLLVFALSHAVLSLLYLLTIVTGLNRARRALSRRNVRRSLDTITAALFGFSAKLTTGHAQPAAGAVKGTRPVASFAGAIGSDRAYVRP